MQLVLPKSHHPIVRLSVWTPEGDDLDMDFDKSHSTAEVPDGSLVEARFMKCDGSFADEPAITLVGDPPADEPKTLGIDLTSAGITVSDPELLAEIAPEFAAAEVEAAAL